MRPPRRLTLTLALGTTQTLAWASSYYLPAVLADVISRDIGIKSTTFFGAFSAALLLSALIGPKVGRTIDTLGGRSVLLLSNICIAAGLISLALTQFPAMLWVAWLLLGLGMGLGLYDAAFATLGRIFGAEARSSITAITLIAGFASTIGWPLSTLGVATIGWRDTCFAWAVANIFLGMPINCLLPSSVPGASSPITGARPSTIVWDRKMFLIAFAMAAAWMVTAAMAAHLPRLLEATGASNAAAVAAGVLRRRWWRASSRRVCSAGFIHSSVRASPPLRTPLRRRSSAHSARKQA